MEGRGGATNKRTHVEIKKKKKRREAVRTG